MNISRHAHSPAHPSNFLPPLEGVRGLAIGLVLVGHTLLFSFSLSSPGKIAGLGVHIFFVLSGFLITRNLWGELKRTGTLSLADFYWRRAYRIIPAWSVFIIAIVALKLSGWIIDTNWPSLLAAIFMVANLCGSSPTTGHLWSLSLEEQFYLLWPFTLRLVGKRGALRAVLVGIVCITLFRWWAIAVGFGDYNTGVFYTRPWFRGDSLLLGGLLALQEDHSSFRSWLTRLHPLTGVSALICLVLVNQIMEDYTLTRIFHLSVEGALSTFLIADIAWNPRSFLGKHLCGRGWRELGKISYSLYLWQQIFFVPGNGLPTLMHFGPFPIVLSIGVAMLSFHYIERPFRRTNAGETL